MSVNGNGPSVELADGPHTIRYSTRRLVEVEKRFGGFEALQTVLLPRLLEVTATLLWAAGKGETEDEAMDAMDGCHVMDLAQTLMVEFARAYAGDEAADATIKAQDEAKAAQEKARNDEANGKAADPTHGDTPLPPTLAMVASPSQS